MKYIIAGTDRPNSNTLKISQNIQKIYKDLGEEVGIIDLKEVKEHLLDDLHYGKTTPNMQPYIDKVMTSEGLIVVCPEYNGSMPGVLKYFIDHLKFPESFEFRPVAFVGLGGRFGGLRPVEHLQQVFGYRNAFIYPERVFVMNVFTIFNDAGEIKDAVIHELLHKQAEGFQKFTAALKSFEIDANSFLSKKNI